MKTLGLPPRRLWFITTQTTTSTGNSGWAVYTVEAGRIPGPLFSSVRHIYYFQNMSLGSSYLFFLASSMLGTVALHCIRFGVSWLVMRETGSAVAFAAVFGVSSLVEVYSKPILAPMADYFDRLKVYRVCIGLASVSISILLVTAIFLPFSVALTTILLMTLSLVAGLRDPASAGLVAALVDADQLTEAQSLRSTIGSFVNLGAPMVSALLLAAGGVPAAMAVAAISSLMGLASTFGVRLVRPEVIDEPKQWSTYLATWHLRTADGIRAVLLTRSERTMALVVALTNAGLYPFFFVILPLWVAKDLDASAHTMAAIEVAFGVGILAGSTFITPHANKLLGRFVTMVLGNSLLGGGLLAAAFFSNSAVLAMCFAISGAGFAVFNINASTLRSAATPAAFRSRMAAGVAFLSSCLNPFATQGMGFVVESSTGATGVALCGTLILVSTSLLLRNADAKSLLSRSNAEIVGAYGKLYPRAFIERHRAATGSA